MLVGRLGVQQRWPKQEWTRRASKNTDHLQKITRRAARRALSQPSCRSIGGFDRCGGGMRGWWMGGLYTKEGLTGDNAILYYTILYYTILYYNILYYTILYCTVLCYAILYWRGGPLVGPSPLSHSPDDKKYLPTKLEPEPQISQFRCVLRVACLSVCMFVCLCICLFVYMTTLNKGHIPFTNLYWKHQLPEIS